MKQLPQFLVSYRIGSGPVRMVTVWTATRGAAIEAVTTGDEAFCARSEILNVRKV